MITSKTVSRLVALPAVFFALLLVACPSHDNPLGSGGTDAGDLGSTPTTTCQQDGNSGRLLTLNLFAHFTTTVWVTCGAAA